MRQPSGALFCVSQHAASRQSESFQRTSGPLFLSVTDAFLFFLEFALEFFAVVGELLLDQFRPFGHRRQGGGFVNFVFEGEFTFGDFGGVAGFQIREFFFCSADSLTVGEDLFGGWIASSSRAFHVISFLI